LLFYALKARDQGLACFSNTRFVAHINTLPRSLVERLENNDIDGKQYGISYGGSTFEIKETLKSEYMVSTVAEKSDMVVVENDLIANYYVSELKVSISEENLRLAEPIPLRTDIVQYLENANDEIEFVFLGSPYLSLTSGVKLMMDALDDVADVETSASFRMTFLGQSVTLNNPEMTTEAFIDLRSYRWSSKMVLSVVNAQNHVEMLQYLMDKSTRKVAVLSPLLTSTGSNYMLRSLVENKISFMVARDALAEQALLYDDWQNVLFQRNSSTAIADRMLNILSENKIENLFARLSDDVQKNPIEQWTKKVYQPIMESEEVNDCPAPKQDPKTLPLVSIVIVHHNRVELLKQTLQSIEEQTYPQNKIEVILVDDGSSDPEASQFINDLAWEW
jgi:hypothetical protein